LKDARGKSAIEDLTSESLYRPASHPDYLTRTLRLPARRKQRRRNPNFDSKRPPRRAGRTSQPDAATRCAAQHPPEVYQRYKEAAKGGTASRPARGPRPPGRFAIAAPHVARAQAQVGGPQRADADLDQPARSLGPEATNMSFIVEAKCAAWSPTTIDIPFRLRLSRVATTHPFDSGWPHL
jgi:hypothetical protein